MKIYNCRLSGQSPGSPSTRLILVLISLSLLAFRSSRGSLWPFRASTRLQDKWTPFNSPFWPRQDGLTRDR